MDIANVSSALNAVSVSEPSSVAGAVSLKMLDNVLDTNASLSEGLTKMMEQSVYPNLGANIDVSV
jgi:hypothetical protein